MYLVILIFKNEGVSKNELIKFKEEGKFKFKRRKIITTNNWFAMT